MKIGRIFNNYVPQKKCGAALGASDIVSLLGAGLGFAGNVYQGNLSSQNVAKQVAMQHMENDINRAWQSNEAEKARDAQSQLAYGLQAKQAEFQSPVYQSQQLRQAGLNPQVYFGQSASFSGSSAPSPSVNGVGSVGGLSPVSYQPPNLNIADILSSIGNFKANDAQAQRTKSLLASELEMYAKDIESKELLNKTARIDLFVKRNIKDSQIKKAWNEVQNVAADTYLKLASGDEKVSLSALNYSQMMLNHALTDKTGQEVAILKNELGTWFERFNVLMDNLRASSEQSRASAEESRASAGLKLSETTAQNMANEIRQFGLDEEKLTTLNKWITEYDIDFAKRSKAIQEWVRLQTMLNAERNSDTLRKINSSLQNLFDLLGLHVSVSAHN